MAGLCQTDLAGLTADIQSDWTSVSMSTIMSPYVDALKRQQLPPDSSSSVEFTLRQLPPCTVAMESGKNRETECESDHGIQFLRASTTCVKHEGVMEMQGHPGVNKAQSSADSQGRNRRVGQEVGRPETGK